MGSRTGAVWGVKPLPAPVSESMPGFSVAPESRADIVIGVMSHCRPEAPPATSSWSSFELSRPGPALLTAAPASQRHARAALGPLGRSP